MAEATPKPEKDSGVIEYVGTADVRSISKAEWAQAGVEGQADLVWDASNGFKVKASDVSEGALAILKNDPAFKLPA